MTRVFGIIILSAITLLSASVFANQETVLEIQEASSRKMEAEIKFKQTIKSVLFKYYNVKTNGELLSKIAEERDRTLKTRRPELLNSMIKRLSKNDDKLTISADIVDLGFIVRKVNGQEKTIQSIQISLSTHGGLCTYSNFIEYSVGLEIDEDGDLSISKYLKENVERKTMTCMG
jgi:hypothetical protein